MLKKKESFLYLNIDQVKQLELQEDVVLVVVGEEHKDLYLKENIFIVNHME
jgi:hypothetical protein